MTHKISPSQMYSWKDCPTAWHFGYVMKLRKVARKQRFFELGTYFHELMHVYYQAIQQGQTPGSEFMTSYMSSRIKRDLATLTEDNVGIVAQVSKMVIQYVASYSAIRDKGIEVLGVEKQIQVPVTTPNGNQVILNCITDLIYRTKNGTLTTCDHKTGQANSWNAAMIPLENQLLFNALAYYLDTGEMPLRVEINFANSYNYKTKQPTVAERFQSFSHTHNPYAIEFYHQQLLKLIDQMIDQSDDPVRHYSKDCSKCQYNPICTQELRGFPTENLIKSQYEIIERDYEVGLKLTGGTTPTGESTSTNENPFKLHFKL